LAKNQSPRQAMADPVKYLEDWEATPEGKATTEFYKNMEVSTH